MEHYAKTLKVANDGTIASIVGEQDEAIAMAQMRASLGQKDPERWANARRLAACWNACAGIATEALEVGAVEQMAGTIIAVRKWLESVPESETWRAMLTDALQYRREGK